jgi:hypothetical protein
MKKLLILAPLALALAACGQTEPTPAPVAPVAATSDTAAPVAAAPAAKRKGGKAVPADALPEGIELSFPYHFRNERTLANKNGSSRQRVTVEYLDDDAATMVPALVESMQAAGFRKMKSMPRNGGGERLVFKKKGYGLVMADVIPDTGQKLAHKRAKGMLWLSWANADASTATAANAP